MTCDGRKMASLSKQPLKSPPNGSVRVLGIDPGLRNLGYALVEFSPDAPPRLLACGRDDLLKPRGLDMKTLMARRDIPVVCDDWIDKRRDALLLADVVVVETQMVQTFVRQEAYLQGRLGAISLHPSTVKSVLGIATGDYRRNKRAAVERAGLRGLNFEKWDDVCDSYLLAVYYATQLLGYNENF